MDLSDYARALRRGLVLLLIGLLVGGVGGLILALSTPKSYSARSQIFISTAPSLQGTDAATLADASKFGLDRVKSYVGLVDANQVLMPVISQLGLSRSVTSLATDVTADNPVDTLLINVHVADGSAARAAQIANAVASELGTVVERLETPVAGGSSPVRATVVRVAPVPSHPTSPRLVLDLLLGVLIGLALGVAAAVARDHLDASVRTDEAVRAVSGRIPLGRIAYSRDLRRSAAKVLEHRTARPIEGYQAVRARLRLNTTGSLPRSILVTSTHAGEGKTITAVGLAIAGSAGGARVCLIEADLRAPAVARYLGFEAGAGLTEVLSGRSTVDEALHYPRGDRLAVLAAGAAVSDPSGLIASKQLRSVMQQLTTRFDQIIVDAPSLAMTPDAAMLARQADGVVVVCRDGKTEQRALKDSIETVREAGAKLLGVVMTFVPTPWGTARSGTDFASNEDTSAADLAGGATAGTPVVAAASAASSPKASISGP